MLGKYCLRLFFGVGVFFISSKITLSVCYLNMKIIWMWYMNMMLVGGHLQVFVGLIALFLVDDGDELTILLTTV